MYRRIVPYSSHNKSEYSPPTYQYKMPRVIGGVLQSLKGQAYCILFCVLYTPFVLIVVFATIQKGVFLMKKKNLIIILSVILVALIALFGSLYFIDKINKENAADKSHSQSQSQNDTDKSQSQSQNDSEEQGNNIIVKLVFADKSEKVFEIKTEASTLADALLEEKLISQEEYDTGFYTTINGIRADYTLDGLWWKFYKNGEESMVGANEITLNEGDSFDIVQTPA